MRARAGRARQSHAPASGRGVERRRRVRRRSLRAGTPRMAYGCTAL